MLTDRKTDALLCDQCGAEIQPEEAGLDEHGDAICARCVAKRRGEREAAKDIHRQQLRFALFSAINDVDLAWTRHELEQLLKQAVQAQFRPLKVAE